MSKQQVIDYLNQNKDKYSLDQLKQALLSAGYSEVDVNEAIQVVEQQSPTSPSQILAEMPLDSDTEGKITKPGFLDQQSPSTRPLKRDWKLKRKLIIAGIIISILLVVGFAGLFGYRQYIKSSDSRILAKTSQNTIRAKNMSTNFRIGVSGISIEGTLNIDNNQNLEANINNPLFPIKAVYLKKDDKIYVKQLDSSFPQGGEDKNKESWIELTHTQEAIEKYSNEFVGSPALIDPNKNYFTGENLKYFKRTGIDKISGKDLIKYNFAPTKEFIEKSIKESKGKLLNFDLKQSSINIDFWIGANDFELYKVKGNIKFEIAPPKEDTGSLGLFNLPNELDFNWEEEFNYDFKGKIELPKNIKITESIDLSKTEEEQGRALQDARDSKRISDLSRLMTLLEHYNTKVGKYPTTLSSLIPDYVKTLPTDPFTENNYSYGVNDATTPTEYTLGARLESSTNTNLNNDVDGTSNGISCNDPVYCVGP